MPGDPQECRKRAIYCAKRAIESASPLAQEKFFNLAKTWMRLAIELEQQWALLDQWGDKPREKEKLKGGQTWRDTRRLDQNPQAGR